MIACGADVNAEIYWTSNYEKTYHDKAYHESYFRTRHSVLSTAIMAGHGKEIIELLVRAGADPNYEIEMNSYHHKEGEAKTADGFYVGSFSLLYCAAFVWKSNDLGIAEVLINAGADVNFKIYNKKGGTDSLLSTAVQIMDYKVARLLLEHGADPNQKRLSSPVQYLHRETGMEKPDYKYFFNEYSLISDAIVRTKDITMLELLLSHGGNPNLCDERIIVNNDGWLQGYAKYSPLVDVLIYPEIGIDFMKILLDNGADPNIKYCYEGVDDFEYEYSHKTEIGNKTKLPVLGIAVMLNKLEAVKTLIDGGASFSAETFYDARDEDEDRFPLSEYAFYDVTEQMKNIIREKGWRGKKFLGKAHRCVFAW